jgi:hypothetical protein
VHGDRVDRQVRAAGFGDAAHLGAEHEALVRLGPKERLDPETVAREEQGPFPVVPDRECEHPVQAVDEVGPELLPQVHEDFGVGTGSELVSARDEPLAQLGVVVDLSVEDDVNRAVLVPLRLRTGVEVDDPQAPERETDAVPQQESFLVGTAMLDPERHALEHFPFGNAPVPARDSGNSAQTRTPPVCWDVGPRSGRADPSLFVSFRTLLLAS